MLYLVLTVILSLFGAFTFLPRFKGLVERYNTGINFLLTLIATMAGVMLAISITNYEAGQSEKQDVIKLLGAAISSVEQCHDYSEELMEYFSKLPKDHALKTDFYQKNPPPYPGYLDTFLTQNIVSKNLSGIALAKLNESLINLKRVQMVNVPLYIETLKLTNELLALEVRFQKGELTETQLDSRVNQLTEELQNFLLGQSSETI
ncbi:hypothetical protein L2750_16310 [Shewanella submarina]|uniref:Uncharacterized protein n=1 Tax=Shewanella submarina TaxID=2016376 RepID=A0ABV7GCR5_9GAMM|nr:hypothetical protein [Shewanella submarina]MCL1038693.1 hypothetical protein [Shewanella submarina]